MSARPARSSLESPVPRRPESRHARRPQVAGSHPGTGALAVAWVSLVLAVWFVVSPLWREYAFTIPGLDAILWAMGAGGLLTVLAAARVRGPRDVRRSTAALSVAAPGVTLLPFPLEWQAGGQQDVPWWNHVVVGAALTLTAFAGLAQVFGARHDP